MTWRCVQSTCVFETDFGLSINCGLKKSGLFRVRNLGGLKGYVGLGKRNYRVHLFDIIIKSIPIAITTGLFLKKILQKQRLKNLICSYFNII